MIKHDVFRYRSEDKWTSNASCEMLLIVPQYDLMVNPSATLELAKQIGAAVVVLNDACGHQSSVLCGRTLIKSEIDKFL